MLVLALYFEQDNQRVCRCDYCWGYFIPKTKKATRYCDRVTDGQSCKQRGANLARLDKTSEDEALLICKRLRDRMYSRLLRWQDAAPSECSNLIPMDYEQYDQWSENARLAREEYSLAKISLKISSKESTPALARTSSSISLIRERRDFFWVLILSLRFRSS